MRAAGPTVVVSATVTNVGDRAGVETPQLYVGLPAPNPQVRQPPKWLKGFTKIALAPGQSRTVRFTLDQRALSYWDVESHAWRVAPGCYRLLVGASSRNIRLRAWLPSSAARSRCS